MFFFGSLRLSPIIFILFLFLRLYNADGPALMDSGYVNPQPVKLQLQLAKELTN